MKVKDLIFYFNGETHYRIEYRNIKFTFDYQEKIYETFKDSEVLECRVENDTLVIALKEIYLKPEI